MLKRIISATVGVVLLVGIVYGACYCSFVLTAAVSLLAAIAVGEAFHATGIWSSKWLTGIGIAAALAVPWVTSALSVPGLVLCAAVVYLTALLCVMIFQKDTVSLHQVAGSVALTAYISFGFTCLDILFRTGIAGGVKRDGVFYLVCAFASAWLCDTGAYFTGRLFGKHKLSPVISPNKTVEGFVGGIVWNMLLLAGWGLWYQYGLSGGASVNLPLLLICGAFSALLGPLGDLSASWIKRQYGIKDYGNIMPGHGGVMDRFDSILTVAPFYLAVITLTASFAPLLVR